jgi:hypothetical protein
MNISNKEQALSIQYAQPTLEVIDADNNVRAYFSKIGRIGGRARRGIPQARERAKRADIAPGAARRAKKEAESEDIQTIGTTVSSSQG